VTTPHAAASLPVKVIPLPSQRTFQPGDDLVDAIAEAMQAQQLTFATHDVLLVTSKVVSLTEGAVVHRSDGDLTTVRREQARHDAQDIVADSPHVLVTRTAHGFVAANGGIDASNLHDDTQLLLLPDNPDRSAATLRQAVQDRFAVELAVIITDTFGRPWRMGQTDVALGVSGIRALRDERGRTDRYGHLLDVTEAAIADALAGASDLVRHKASGTPFVLIRGVDPELFDRTLDGEGAALIRPPERDLFRYGGPTAIERGLSARRTVRQFTPEVPVDPTVLDAAVRAAITVSAPHGSQPWRFIELTAETRTVLLDRMAAAWQADLQRDGVPADVIARRQQRSDTVLRLAPTLIVAFVDVADADTYADRRRQAAEYDLFLLAGGAAIQNFQVTLSAHGAASAWISAPLFCADVIRTSLALPVTYRPLGMIAAGYPLHTPPTRPDTSAEPFWQQR
jgi:coenzyme F420-0:L-glutamate ligase / coenzyme F420-1:gamma-L-glutamate ligase